MFTVISQSTLTESRRPKMRNYNSTHEPHKSHEEMYLEIRVLWELCLHVPEPAGVHDSEEERPEEVPDEDGDEGEHGVHDGELDELLAEHRLPAELAEVELLLQW